LSLTTAISARNRSIIEGWTKHAGLISVWASLGSPPWLTTAKGTVRRPRGQLVRDFARSLGGKRVRRTLVSPSSRTMPVVNASLQKGLASHQPYGPTKKKDSGDGGKKGLPAGGGRAFILGRKKMEGGKVRKVDSPKKKEAFLVTRGRTVGPSEGNAEGEGKKNWAQGGFHLKTNNGAGLQRGGEKRQITSGLSREEREK